MALEDIIGGGNAGPNERRIPVHQFMALLHWRIKDPVKVTNAKAKTVLEGELGRSLTAGETTTLLAIINDVETNVYTARDLEAAYMLKENGWITLAEAKALLGL
jgi:hypothetical protein